MEDRFEITYQTTIDAPIDLVWDALVNPDIVKQYFYGSTINTDWQIGSPIEFTGEYEGKSYKDKGEIQEYIPNQVLSYSYLSDWSGLEDVPENYLLVTYRVQKLDEGTELTITQTNYDEEKAAHSKESWQTVVEGLKKIVE